MATEIQLIDDILFGEDILLPTIIPEDEILTQTRNHSEVGDSDSDVSNQEIDVGSFSDEIYSPTAPSSFEERLSPCLTLKTSQEPDECRVLKMDSSGKLRMGKTIRVLNQSPQIFKSQGIDINRNVRACQSKSAIAARENRERKKRYVSGLEAAVNRLKCDNKKLADDRSTLMKETDSLRREVKYLRNVLANQSSLSSLLRNIPSVSGLSFVGGKITSDVTTLKRKSSNADVSTPKQARLSDQKDVQSCGICLHVSGSRVSMELCAACNDQQVSADV